MGSTTPEGLGAIASAYGPNGSCWSAAPDSVCLDACRTGLRNVRNVHSDAKACPECVSDPDCAGVANGAVCDTKTGRCVACTSDASCDGATPACDLALHTCVACTTSVQCKGGVCDAATHTCVACATDRDCAAPTGRCKRLANGQSACVACSKNADCPTGSCSGDGSCCQPESCGQLKKNSGYNPATWVCGVTYSSTCPGGIVSCGGCSRGTCNTSGGTLGRCSLEDTPCTPGTSGTCMPDEVCTYVPGKKAYVCSVDVRGSQCVYGGGVQCASNHFSCDGANLVNNGVCRAYCLIATDCAAGERCSVYPQLGYGECMPP